MSAMITGQAQNVPITLNQGWNWISYPRSESMSINDALSGFTPMVGDIIVSQTDGSAQYLNGRWRGNLTTLIPGKGYMYKSVDGTTKSFIFGGASNDPSGLPEEALEGEFTVDANGTKVRFSPGNLQCRIDPTLETQATVGTGTSATAYMPYNTYYKYSLCQMIYKASELTAAGLGPGLITSMAFESYSNLHYLRNGIEIWILPTTQITVSSTSTNVVGTSVFSGSLIQQEGWTPVYFSTPFTWDGNSNLLVTIAMSHGSYDYPYINWRCSSTGYTSSCYAYSDTTPYYPTTSGGQYSTTTSTYRPNTRFNGKGGTIWHFAEKQWDYIGSANANISSSYAGWIDLFGWGTSGHPHGAVCYQPWSTSMTNSDYYAYGSESYNLFDQTGEADWGCNPISNGGNKPNQWRTLTGEEWGYVIDSRSTASGNRYAKAQVSGVNGMILLPDNWNTSYYSLSSMNNASANYTVNIISASQWSTLEQHGAVFLPAAGYRAGTSLSNNMGVSGIYHTSNSSNSMAFHASTVYSQGNNLYWGRGKSVRLVCQTNPRIRTIGVSNVTSTSATVSAEVDYTGSAGYRYICRNTTGYPTVTSSINYGGTGTGSFNVTMTGLQPNTTYHIRACSYINGAYRYGNELTFTTSDNGSNGHAYVDLGLPSGLLWATCNVGATSSEGYGNYYAWGETTTKSEYNWSTYQHCNGSSSTLTKYCTNSEYGNNGFVDNITTLLLEDDIATYAWGGDWRMPTKEEWQELRDNTTRTWTTQNGVDGMRFTGSNGNSIFLPVAGIYNGSSPGGSTGQYWASSLYTDNTVCSWTFYFDSSSCNMSQGGRAYGRSIRAVRTPR